MGVKDLTKWLCMFGDKINVTDERVSEEDCTLHCLSSYRDTMPTSPLG